MRRLSLVLLTTIAVAAAGIFAVQDLLRPETTNAAGGSPVLDASGSSGAPTPLPPPGEEDEPAPSPETAGTDNGDGRDAEPERSADTEGPGDAGPDDRAPSDAADAFASRPEEIVPANGAYLGAYIDGLMEPDGLSTWEAHTGVELGIAHWYQGWGDTEDNQLSRQWLERAREHGTIPMITWEPWDKPPDSFTDVNQQEFSLARIAEGDHDDHIREWGAEAAADGGPLLVRFAHEMNGNWYPWSVVENDNTPDDYVRAWRHVHDLVTDEGADNIEWVWSVNTTAGLDPTLAELDLVSFYPGDDYVDWVSVVGFNHGTSREWSVWRDADRIFAEIYEELVAFDKPVMISEIGTVDVGGDAAEWVRDALRAFERDYPEVAAVVWFEGLRAEGIDFRLDAAARRALGSTAIESGHWVSPAGGLVSAGED